MRSANEQENERKVDKVQDFPVNFTGRKATKVASHLNHLFPCSSLASWLLYCIEACGNASSSSQSLAAVIN